MTRLCRCAPIALALLCLASSASATSPKSADGIFTYNEYVTQTLRASAAETTTTLQTGTAVTGFGGWRECEIFVQITAVSFTGGVSPTAALTVWLQMTPDGGTTWEDVLATKSAALAAAGTEKDLGWVNLWSPGTPSVPAIIQTAGGTPPFAQRHRALSDSLRISWQLTVTGAPTAQSVTFSVQARGR